MVNDANDILDIDGGVHLGGLLVVNEADLGIGILLEDILDGTGSLDAPVIQDELRLGVHLRGTGGDAPVEGGSTDAAADGVQVRDQMAHENNVL